MLNRKDGSPLKIGPGSRFAMQRDTRKCYIFDAQGYVAYCDNELCEYSALDLNDFQAITRLAANPARRKRSRIVLLQETEQMIVYKLIGVKPRSKQRVCKQPTKHHARRR